MIYKTCLYKKIADNWMKETGITTDEFHANLAF